MLLVLANVAIVPPCINGAVSMHWMILANVVTVPPCINGAISMHWMILANVVTVPPCIKGDVSMHWMMCCARKRSAHFSSTPTRIGARRRTSSSVLSWLRLA